MAQIACPGCGVSISPGQGMCGFCTRQRELDSTPRRGRLVGVALATVLVLSAGGMALFRSSLLRNYPPKFLAPPVVPSAEPIAALPHVEVSETTLSLDGTKLLDLPPLEEQARVGVGPSNEVPSNFIEITALRDALEPLRARPQADPKALVTFAPQTPYRLVISVLFTVGQGGYGRYRLEVNATSGTPSVAIDTFAPASRKADAPSSGEPQNVRGLIASVGRAHVDLEARNDEHREHLGFGCAPGGLGYTMHWGTPEDPKLLGSCLNDLRGHVAARSGASAVLTASNETSALNVLQVASMLQCGALSCPRGSGDAALFAGPTFSLPRTYPSPPEHLQATVAKLRRAFRGCYREFLAQERSERGYDTLAQVDVRPDGHGAASIDPGLPTILAECLVGAVQKTRFPGSTKGVILRFPISFVWQGAPEVAP